MLLSSRKGKKKAKNIFSLPGGVLQPSDGITLPLPQGDQISAGCCGSCSDKPTGQVHHSGANPGVHTLASAIHNSTVFNVLSKEEVFQALHKEVSGFCKKTRYGDC